MKQAKELGATFRIMGGDAMDNPRSSRSRRGGGRVRAHHLPVRPVHDRHEPDREEVHRELEEGLPTKEPNVNAALGYDTYLMVLDAIKRAGKAEPPPSPGLGLHQGLRRGDRQHTINANPRR